MAEGPTLDTSTLRKESQSHLVDDMTKSVGGLDSSDTPGGHPTHRRSWPSAPNTKCRLGGLLLSVDPH